MKTRSILLSLILLSFLFAHPSIAKTDSLVVEKEIPSIQLDYWVVVRINPGLEYVPGVGYRTTAILESNGIRLKVYCLDPNDPIPPVGTQCERRANGNFYCGENYQRFKEFPGEEQPTPTPSAVPSPTPQPFSCSDLGLGLHVTYGKKLADNNTKSTINFIAKQPMRDFWLEPLAIAPDEIWESTPIRMVFPNNTCGRYTVHGLPQDLPPSVVKVEVFIDCPGLHLDLSSEAADGGYCFGCKDINFNQNLCTVTNRLYVQWENQIEICQAFYKVIDPVKMQAYKNADNLGISFREAYTRLIIGLH